MTLIKCYLFWPGRGWKSREPVLTCLPASVITIQQHDT